MVIQYCDWDTGNDTTGDGSAGNPYKTIQKASNGLAGGDEVRVGKSTAHTALSGTLAWVDGSNLVNTSVDLTLSLSPGDFVGKDTAGETWWEVISLTAATLTLHKAYSGVTATVASKKLGITSTGEAPSYNTQVQYVDSSGTSAVSKLEISGGWDLGTETKNGETWFRQMHSTFSTRNGYGLYISGKSYLNIEDVNFLRYYRDMYFYNVDYSDFTGITAIGSRYENFYLGLLDNCTFTNINPSASNGRDGFYIYSSNNISINNIVCRSNSAEGIELAGSCSLITITNVNCRRNGGRGLYMYDSYLCDFSQVSCNYNSYGIYIDELINSYFDDITCDDNSNDGLTIGSEGAVAFNNTFYDVSCNNNGSYGIYYTSPGVNIINNYSGSGNASGDTYIDDAMRHGEFPILKCQHFNSDKADKAFCEDGILEHITGAEARGGSGDALRFDPSSATYYIAQSFYYPADSGVGKTLKIYMKDDVSFNGDVQAAIYFLGKRITGWTAWAMTTNYIEQSIAAGAIDITEDGVLELRIRVRGTAGYVYADDLSAT